MWKREYLVRHMEHFKYFHLYYNIVIFDKTVIHLAPMLVPLALARLATSCLPPHHSQVIKMQLATVASWFLSQLKGPRPAIQHPYKK